MSGPSRLRSLWSLLTFVGGLLVLAAPALAGNEPPSLCESNLGISVKSYLCPDVSIADAPPPPLTILCDKSNFPNLRPCDPATDCVSGLSNCQLEICIPYTGRYNCLLLYPYRGSGVDVDLLGSLPGKIEVCAPHYGQNVCLRLE